MDTTPTPEAITEREQLVERLINVLSLDRNDEAIMAQTRATVLEADTDQLTDLLASVNEMEAETAQIFDEQSVYVIESSISSPDLGSSLGGSGFDSYS